MYQIFTMLQIILGWTIIFWILEYMIEGGLIDEVRRLIREIGRKIG